MGKFSVPPSFLLIEASGYLDGVSRLQLHSVSSSWSKQSRSIARAATRSPSCTVDSQLHLVHLFLRLAGEGSAPNIAHLNLDRVAYVADAKGKGWTVNGCQPRVATAEMVRLLANLTELRSLGWRNVRLQCKPSVLRAFVFSHHLSSVTLGLVSADSSLPAPSELEDVLEPLNWLSSLRTLELDMQGIRWQRSPPWSMGDLLVTNGSRLASLHIACDPHLDWFSLPLGVLNEGSISRLRSFSLTSTPPVGTKDAYPVFGLPELLTKAPKGATLNLRCLERHQTTIAKLWTDRALACMHLLPSWTSLRRLYAGNVSDRSELEIIGSLTQLEELAVAGIFDEADVVLLRRLSNLRALAFDAYCAAVGSDKTLVSFSGLAELVELRSLALDSVSTSTLDTFRALRPLVHLRSVAFHLAFPNFSEADRLQGAAGLLRSMLPCLANPVVLVYGADDDKRPLVRCY